MYTHLLNCHRHRPTHILVAQQHTHNDIPHYLRHTITLRRLSRASRSHFDSSTRLDTINHPTTIPGAINVERTPPPPHPAGRRRLRPTGAFCRRSAGDARTIWSYLLGLSVLACWLCVACLELEHHAECRCRISAARTFARRRHDDDDDDYYYSNPI